MTEDLLTRARELAVYIIETRTTIRQAAKHFGLSKSTVHKDLAERLPAANHALYSLYASDASHSSVATKRLAICTPSAPRSSACDISF